MPCKVSTDLCAPDPSPEPERRGRKKEAVNQEDRDWILRLVHQQGRSSRQVSDITGVTRPVVRRVLEENREKAPAQTPGEGQPLAAPTATPTTTATPATPEGPPPSKLAAFAQAIQERVKKGLTAKRILREIREQGYKGSLRSPSVASGLTVRRCGTRATSSSPRTTARSPTSAECGTRIGRGSARRTFATSKMTSSGAVPGSRSPT